MKYCEMDKRFNTSAVCSHVVDGLCFCDDGCDFASENITPMDLLRKIDKDFFETGIISLPEYRKDITAMINHY
jgi:hypothetical protein